MQGLLPREGSNNLVWNALGSCRLGKLQELAKALPKYAGWREPRAPTRAGLAFGWGALLAAQLGTIYAQRGDGAGLGMEAGGAVEEPEQKRASSASTEGGAEVVENGVGEKSFKQLVPIEFRMQVGELLEDGRPKLMWSKLVLDVNPMLDVEESVFAALTERRPEFQVDSLMFAGAVVSRGDKKTLVQLGVTRDCVVTLVGRLKPVDEAPPAMSDKKPRSLILTEMLTSQPGKGLWEHSVREYGKDLGPLGCCGPCPGAASTWVWLWDGPLALASKKRRRNGESSYTGPFELLDVTYRLKNRAPFPENCCRIVAILTATDLPAAQREGQTLYEQGELSMYHEPLLLVCACRGKTDEKGRMKLELEVRGVPRNVVAARICDRSANIFPGRYESGQGFQ